MACLHLGEPSCRYYNRFLDRSVLFGARGYLTASNSEVVAAVEAAAGSAKIEAIPDRLRAEHD
jgi:hypothetical protein